MSKNAKIKLHKKVLFYPQFCISIKVVGFVMDKAVLGQVFSEYFGFPCQSFHQFLHHHNHPGLAQ
jgi:hypothetical protein